MCKCTNVIKTVDVTKTFICFHTYEQKITQKSDIIQLTA